MITADLTQKINLLPQESYDKVESFVEHLLSINAQKKSALKMFMEKMDAAEKSVKEQGCFTEEEVEEELAKL